MGSWTVSGRVSSRVLYLRVKRAARLVPGWMWPKAAKCNLSSARQSRAQT